MSAARKETWTLSRLIPWAEAFLKNKGVENPRLDAELLVSHSLGLKRIQLYTQWDRPLVDSELQALKPLLRRRADREPLAYITGEKEFYSLKFKVRAPCLIPRPETEQLVDLGLEKLRQTGPAEPKVLELGVGSACVSIALLKHCPTARAWALDWDETALALAAENALHHGLSERLTLVPGDLSQPWPQEIQGPFDLVMGNLPYIPRKELDQLAPEIRHHEAPHALSPGESGLEAFEWVFPQLPGVMARGAWALLEMGAGQGGPLSALARETLPDFSVTVQKDLQGLERVLVLGQA